jgi:threonine/homoserine/homoserine lactone efflux protein
MLVDMSLMPMFLIAVLLLMITPGPDMIFVVANALGGGRKAGFVSLIGVATGAYLHILAAAAGITAILVTSEAAYNIVRFAGAGYLAYVGVSFLTSKSAVSAVNPALQQPLMSIYRQGVITNLLNPKAALFTLSFVPQFISPEFGSVWSQMLILGLLIVVTMVLVDLPLILASGYFAERLDTRSGMGLQLGKVIGVLLIILAIYVAVSRKPA